MKSGSLLYNVNKWLTKLKTVEIIKNQQMNIHLLNTLLAQPSRKPPQQKMARIEKQRDTPLLEKTEESSRVPRSAGTESYTSRHFLHLTDFTLPLQFLKLFFDDKMITGITIQTNLHASQHYVQLEVTADELGTVFGGILLSSYRW